VLSFRILVYERKSEEELPCLSKIPSAKEKKLT